MKQSEYEEVMKSFFKPVFEKYPDLKAVPLATWGRCYKYECAGEPFYTPTEYNFDGFGDIDHDSKLDKEALRKLDAADEILVDTFYKIKKPARKKMVSWYGGDEDRGGLLLFLTRNLTFQLQEVDSPE